MAISHLDQRPILYVKLSIPRQKSRKHSVYSMAPAGKPDDERASEEKPSEWVTALRGPLTEEVVK